MEDFQINVPEQEWFRHTTWFRAEQIERRMRRRENIITVAAAVFAFVATFAVFAAFGGY